MTFHWLQLRIAEEKDRKQREAMIRERLPSAFEELHLCLAACVASYTSEFGPEAAEIERGPSKIRIVVREERNGTWQQQAQVEITGVETLPGFEIDRAGQPMVVEVGMLPDDKVFYREPEQNTFLTLEELTRRILDSAFFPKLKE